MRETVLGVIVVGLVIGVVIGRTTERARRNMKDLSLAKTAVTKGRTVAFAEIRRAVFILLLTGGLMLALFLGIMNVPS